VLVVTTVGFLILIGVGVAAGVDWGPLPTTLALVLATSIGASGTLLLIMSLAGTERQADAISTIVIMLWSLLGGAFVPLSQMPSFLEPVAGATLVYWAVAGFNASIQQEATIAGVLVNLLVLSSVGIAFLAVGGALLRRRMARGGDLMAPIIRIALHDLRLTVSDRSARRLDGGAPPGLRDLLRARDGRQQPH
jgi:ABC-type multidrug transport system permease subunit